MANSITDKKDVLEVVFDPGFIINQPAPLRAEDGEPVLTGYSIGAVLTQLARQIISVKAPELYNKTKVPLIMTEVVFLRGQFVIRFTSPDVLSRIPAGQPLMDELGNRAKKNALASDAPE